MLETLSLIVRLGKMAEGHRNILLANCVLTTMDDPDWTRFSTVRHDLLTRIRGSLAIIGLDPEAWPILGHVTPEKVTWS